MNRAHTFLEESLSEGDWTLQCEQDSERHCEERRGAHAMTRVDRQEERAAWCRLLGGTPARHLLESRRKHTAEVGRRAAAARRGWRRCERFWKAKVPAYCFPTTEQRQTEEPDGRLMELEESFVCDEPEGDEKCNNRFANYPQLMAHKTRKHGVRTVLGLLTRTNECPWCRSPLC